MSDTAPRRPTGHSDRPLRRGWTTGACATAAAKAAFQALLTGAFPDPVTIRLPRGETPAFVLNRTARGEDWARASVIKDAGDDPDVTHRAEIVATLRRGQAGSGIRFKAGQGVGTVTLAGLPEGARLSHGEEGPEPSTWRLGEPDLNQRTMLLEQVRHWVCSPPCRRTPVR